MRVVSRTRDQLVVRDDPGPLWVIALTLIVASMFPLHEGIRLRMDTGTATGEWTLLVALAGVGIVTALVFLLGLGPVTFIFDRKVGVLEVRRRTLLGRLSWGCSLASLTDAVLEPYVGIDGHVLYRVALVTGTGRHIPLAAHYEADSAAQTRLVLALRYFLQVRAWHKVVAECAIDRRSWRRTVAFLSGSAVAMVMLSLACLLMVWTARQKLAEFRPVGATVLSTRVETTAGLHGEALRRPVVVYRYIVGGRVYVSDAVGLDATRREGQWAFDVVNRFTPGERRRAFYDPRNPQHSFLLEPRSRGWYVLGLLPLLLLVAIVWSLRAHLALVPAEERRASGTGSLEPLIIYP